MKYNSICCICGRETERFDGLMEHVYNKAKDGYIAVEVSFSRYTEEGNFQKHIRSIDFCYSCSRKSYTIEELKTIGNYNQWSY
jgi:hypothetical protein